MPSCIRRSRAAPLRHHCTRTWATSTWSSSGRHSSLIQQSYLWRYILPSRIQGKGSSCSRAYSQSAWRFGHWSMAASRIRSRTSCFPLGPIPAKTNHPRNNIKLDIPTADIQPTTMQNATHKTAKPKKNNIDTTKEKKTREHP
jgi:hypothetical protein